MQDDWSGSLKLAIHIAAEAGRADMISTLVGCGAAVQDPKYSIQPIHCATIHGHIAAVKRLVELKADVHVRTDSGFQAIHHAVARGLAGMVEVLVECGAKVDATVAGGVRPIHIAACSTGAQGLHNTQNYAAVLATLVEHGARVDVADESGWQPIHHAVNAGHVDRIEALGKLGVKMDTCNEEGDSLVHFAVLQKVPLGVIAKLVEMGACVDVHNNRGYQPIHIAARLGQVDVVKELVRVGASVSAYDAEGFQPVHIATQFGHIELLTELVGLGATINAPTRAK